MALKCQAILPYDVISDIKTPIDMIRENSPPTHLLLCPLGSEGIFHFQVFTTLAHSIALNNNRYQNQRMLYSANDIYFKTSCIEFGKAFIQFWGFTYNVVCCWSGFGWNKNGSKDKLWVKRWYIGALGLFGDISNMHGSKLLVITGCSVYSELFRRPVSINDTFVA